MALVLKPKESERFVNVKVSNKLAFEDGFIGLIGTLFLFSIIWQMRTTEISADRVDATQAQTQAK